jgi:mannitol-1-phosphate 5-dehydrogenase
MRKAIVYGAGNVGRGLIGQLFSKSGYEVVFIDTNLEIVEQANKDRLYPIKIVSDYMSTEETVYNMRAVKGMDFKQIALEIAEADIMATSVGVNILPKIAMPIARGLRQRWENHNMEPLNIIVCENLDGGDRHLKELIKNELNYMENQYLEELVGFVMASIGRMIPVMTPEMQQGNILRIYAEEYCELPVDKDGFKGNIPDIMNMIPFSPFECYIKRKLFIHNMGHAITAYLGALKGYKYIWESACDASIIEISSKAMMEAAQAISLEYTVEYEELLAHANDLIYRFKNRQLGDTIERVGRDLQRKLSPNDRLVGALNLCAKNHIEPIGISIGIAAALLFKDSIPSEVSSMINENRVEEVLEKVCGLSETRGERGAILRSYNLLASVCCNKPDKLIINYISCLPNYS